MNIIRGAGRGGLALWFGLVVGLPAVLLVHDLLPAHPPAAASVAMTVTVVVIAALAVGRPFATAVRRKAGLRRAGAALLGATLGAVPVASPVAALLRAPIEPVAQLAWTLGEEDNAQIVGVAREVIVHGPSGGVLADQYGTGFIVGATTLMRSLGLPDPALDPRLLAIHAFTLSTLLVIVTIATATTLLVITSIRAEHGPRLGGLALLAVATAGAVLAALAVTVVLPMRTGFLSFAWGIGWVVLGAAVGPLLADPDTPRSVANAAAVHVLVTTLLVVRSWPFLLAAAAPAFLLVALRLPLAALGRRLRRSPLLAVAGAGVVLVGIGLYLANSALGEVLSYGLDAFTISASGIEFDDRLGLAVACAAVIGAVLVRPWTVRRTLAIAGPSLTAWLSWLLLTGAAAVLTDGELNYGGTKLLYGVVAVAMVTAAPAVLVGWTGRSARTAMPRLAVAGAVALLLGTSGTVATVTEWEARLAPAQPPHAAAVIEAIARTDPTLPVRCRPRPGTVVTPTSRWAAYFCVRWVEDALNDADRASGFRIDYLTAPEGTFDPIVAEATVAGHYGFAYVMDLGPGWFGWDGRS